MAIILKNQKDYVRIGGKLVSKRKNITLEEAEIKFLMETKQKTGYTFSYIIQRLIRQEMDMERAFIAMGREITKKQQEILEIAGRKKKEEKKDV